MPTNWTESEDRMTVKTYFDMLASELKGESYNKSAIRRTVLPHLNDRSHGSLELKNQNISAVLIQLGYPFIDGYKPRSNFQALLAETVEAYLKSRPDLIHLMGDFVARTEESPTIDNILSIFDDQPPKPEKRSYGSVAETQLRYNFTGTNFLELQARNRHTGLSGEKLALEYERQRLIHFNKDHLARRIEHISVEKGDGFGYDIHSYNTDGTDLFIEVKSTKLRKETPFFITQNEVRFSTENRDNYSLYRVYHLTKSPRLFTLHGDITTHCALSPTEYRARFA